VYTSCFLCAFFDGGDPFPEQEYSSGLPAICGVVVHFAFSDPPHAGGLSLLVACESNAYGMPAITTRTGGVPDVVLDGVNGYCLPLEAGGAEYGRLIADLLGISKSITSWWRAAGSDLMRC